MLDLSGTRKIYSVSTQNGLYCAGEGYGYYDKITPTEKAGDGSYVLWYQCWKGGEVVREINSRLVIDVKYVPTAIDPISF